jgi:hypothetical protein
MSNEKHLEEILHELHIRGLISVFNEKIKDLDFKDGRDKYFTEVFKVYDEIIATQKN